MDWVILEEVGSLCQIEFDSNLVFIKCSHTIFCNKKIFFIFILQNTKIYFILSKIKRRIVSTYPPKMCFTPLLTQDGLNLTPFTK